MIKNIIKSIIKSFRLRNISKKLAQPRNKNEKNDFLDELINIGESDEYVKLVCSEFGANRSTLKEIYSLLLRAGAGQYAGGHYVAASSLVYPLTLKFLLENYDGKQFSIDNWSSYNSLLFIANRLIEYFENREMSEVKY
ncbi:MAG: hypothetical protein R3E32_25100 [Chitinophagales bacterium]